MNILIVNPIIYTSETPEIKKVNSIKDTMSYDLCLAFTKKGYQVTLVAGDLYRPLEQETYPFSVVWAPCKLTKIFRPNVLPYCPEIKKLVRENHYDLIISSEVFSLSSFMLAGKCNNRLIIWHELAKHNNLMKQIPSKFWYGIVAKLRFKKTKIVPRSAEAKNFISQFCGNVSETVIDHGVNLDKFEACTEKKNYFVVSSQLIARKQIDKIITAFGAFVRLHPEYRLYILGEGDKEAELKALTEQEYLSEYVTFLGKVPHETLKEYLKKAKAMLIYTRKDNNMISVVESIACATPIITTTVPYNASYIRNHRLGIVNDHWDEDTLWQICCQNDDYIKNCLAYRHTLSAEAKVDLFINEFEKMK